MLNYFKKKSRRKSNDADADASGAPNGCDVVDSGAKRNSLRSTSSFCDEIFWEGLAADEEDAVSCSGANSLSSANIVTGIGVDEETFKCHSRLSMSLPAIVNDLDCLSCFVQYLETKDALPLIKFYLDTENFKAAALVQLEKEKNIVANGLTTDKDVKFNGMDKDEASVDEQEIQQQHQQLHRKEKIKVKNRKAGLTDGTNGKNNSVPELKTLCDISMRKPLTDDEKSQIYAETNKQITKCTTSNRNNNYSTSSNSSEMKASSEVSLCDSESTTATELGECEDGAGETNSEMHVSAASTRDAIAIYQKYLSTNAQHFVSLPVGVLAQISLLLCQHCDDDVDDDGNAVQQRTLARPISTNCFDNAQHYVLEELERHYLNDFLQSTFYCKYCVELIESAYSHSGKRAEKLTIYDILYSEATLFFFMEYLEQRGERDCLDFWSGAINFRKTFASIGDLSTQQELEAQADAMIIYEKFFSLQSDKRLWMSDKLRCHVEERICALGTVACCFDLPLFVTAKYLKTKYFDDFLRSQLFENYLNELKAKIQEELTIGTISNDVMTEGSAALLNAAIGHHKLSLRRRDNKTSYARHRKTMSDCSSESTRDLVKHISQQNTLLASADPASHLRHLQTSGTNLSIDARQLTNPNLLWHRANSTGSDADGGTSGGLQFGRINSLGRYERDFEAADGLSSVTKSHSWSLAAGGSKIKNAMRKLVNLPEDKVQEEIAWQVAEMIIKDVTSITLHNNPQ